VAALSLAAVIGAENSGGTPLEMPVGLLTMEWLAERQRQHRCRKGTWVAARRTIELEAYASLWLMAGSVGGWALALTVVRARKIMFIIHKYCLIQIWQQLFDIGSSKHFYLQAMFVI